MAISVQAAAATAPDDAGVHVPGILRDDRAALAQIHALATAWYGGERRPCSWAMKCFGMGSNWITDQGVSMPYPSMGSFIKQIKANGQVYSVNTPVTGISYDHEAGVTYWQSDFNDLDFGNISISRG
jgi:hypothetical protein